jgi:hypothetical protein
MARWKDGTPHAGRVGNRRYRQGPSPAPVKIFHAPVYVFRDAGGKVSDVEIR